MEALILSCGTGGGHNSAGRAVKEELEARGHHAVMIDPYAMYGSRINRYVDGVYIMLAQKIPHAFEVVYKLGDLYRHLPVRSPVYHVNRAMVKPMLKYLNEHPADVVIMPHLFPAEIFTAIRRKGYSVPYTIFVGTDYTCIPFTEETDCDAYVLPAKELKDDYIRRGTAPDRLYPFGIPVSRMFHRRISKTKARKHLRLHVQKKYILLSGGNIGAGRLQLAVEVLSNYYAEHASVELIVICAGNQKLFHRLNRLCRKNVRVLQHTNEMAFYLYACDVFVTKPGGLSSTEAMTAMIPLIHISPISGCEVKNAEFFEARGMSIYVRDIPRELPKQTDAVLFSERGKQLQAMQYQYRLPNAAEEICNLAERGVTDQSSQTASRTSDRKSRFRLRNKKYRI